MPKVSPNKNSNKAEKIALILIAIVAISGYFGDKAYKNYRAEKANQKWERVQIEAAKKGIYTDIDAYLESISGEGPKLFEDFPWVKDFMTHDTETVFEIHEQKGFKELTLPSSSQTHAENLETLRTSLSAPPAEDASEVEIYRALLAAIAPANEELDTFKNAVQQCNSLGQNSGKDELFFFNASSIRNASLLLLLRNHCHLQLGSNDISDIQAISKLCGLIDQQGIGLISLSVSIAIDLNTAAAINAYCQSPLATSETATNLLACFSQRNLLESFSRQMQLEYALQLYLLDQLKAGTSSILGESDVLNFAPQYVLNELLADTAEFNQKLYFSYYSTSPNLLHPDHLTSSLDVQNENYATASKDMISVLGGMSQGSLKLAVAG